MRVYAPKMTDKDFLTHDNMQINKTWKYYWRQRILWVTSKLEKRKLQQEKSESRRRIHKFSRRASRNQLKRVANNI